MWNNEVRRSVMAHNGSVQQLLQLPLETRELFKTAWEMKMRAVLQMAADRGPFIDQSQSLNVFLAEPQVPTIAAMHLSAWKLGLKTGMYYLRTRGAAEAVKFTVAPEAARQAPKQEAACARGCDSCGA